MSDSAADPDVIAHAQEDVRDSLKRSEDPKSLRQSASSGFTWLAASMLLGKIFIFAAQIVLGWILTEEDFGVLAIVSAVIAFTKVFHDGGISQVLVQRGSVEFEKLKGTAFWMVLTVSTAAGLVLAALSPTIARLYGDARLTSLLAVLAINLPLGAAVSILRAKLQINLQFRALAVLASMRFVIRSLGMVILALFGFGAMSFVIPILFVTAYELVATYLYARTSPWSLTVVWREWPSLMKDSVWVVVAAVSRGVARNGDYLVLGLLLSQDLLGQYYFGYQLTIQMTWLVALNLRNVLFPIMTKLANNPVRQAAAITRAIRMLMFVMAPAGMVLAVVIRPLEELIWHGKWAGAVPLMQVFAVVSPILIFSDVVHSVLTSRGRFRMSGAITLLEGAWLPISAWTAVQIAGTEDITRIAIYIFGLQLCLVLVGSAFVLKTLGIPLATFVASLLPQWSVALVATGATLFAARWLPDETPSLVQIPILATTYLACYSVLALALLRSELTELANVAPAPVGAALRKVFFLRPRDSVPL